MIVLAPTGIAAINAGGGRLQLARTLLEQLFLSLGSAIYAEGNIMLLFVRFDSSVIVFSFLPGTDTYTGENESPFFAQGQCISVSFPGLQGDGRQQPAVCCLLYTSRCV